MWMSIISGILGVLPGAFGSINKVTDAIANERLKQIDAKTKEDQLAAEERTKTLEAQRDALIAESNKSNVPIYVQSFVGASVAFLVGKLLVWDKALGSLTHGYTDPLGTDLRWIMMTVIGFYFLSSTAYILKK